MRRYGILAALLVVSLASGSCTSPDPRLSRSVDDVFAQERNASYGDAVREPWRAGQWVLLRLNDDGVRSHRRISVVGRDGDHYRLAEHSVWVDRERHSEVVVSGYDPADLSRLEIVDARLTGAAGDGVGDDGAGGDENTLETARRDWRELFARMAHARSRGKEREIRTPAGTFRGSHATPISEPEGDDRWIGFVWSGEAVPVIHLVKLEVDKTSFLVFDSHRSFEVVDFGS